MGNFNEYCGQMHGGTETIKEDFTVISIRNCERRCQIYFAHFQITVICSCEFGCLKMREIVLTFCKIDFCQKLLITKLYEKFRKKVLWTDGGTRWFIEEIYIVISNIEIQCWIEKRTSPLKRIGHACLPIDLLLPIISPNIPAYEVGPTFFYSY